MVAPNLTPEEISAFFEHKAHQWHHAESFGDDSLNLQQVLCMTDSEFAAWVRDDTVPVHLLTLFADEIAAWKAAQASGGTVYLIWVTVGTYGDPDLPIVASSEEAAKTWCNEHRKLGDADPIQWTVTEGADPVPVGIAHRYKTPLMTSRQGTQVKIVGTKNEPVYYTIESRPLI